MVESEESSKELFGDNFGDDGKMNDCLFSDLETGVFTE